MEEKLKGSKKIRKDESVELVKSDLLSVIGMADTYPGSRRVRYNHICLRNIHTLLFSLPSMMLYLVSMLGLPGTLRKMMI